MTAAAAQNSLDAPAAPDSSSALDIKACIKEIGRGQKGARDLPRADAERLFAAILDGRVPDLQLGALLIALRVKGESCDELGGFLAACEASYAHLASPAGRIPIVIPSYNGARQLPNLVPLLAGRLAAGGVPVLVHGVLHDPGRTATLEVFEAMGVGAARTIGEAEAQLEARSLTFLPVDRLAPKIAGLLALRGQLGVRSSGHTLVKMLNPFRGRALRLVSVTHPEYIVRMRNFFATQPGADVLLLRGAEGEAVAHPRRKLDIERLHGGRAAAWSPEAREAEAAAALPASKEAVPTARWIEAALGGRAAIPRTIEFQIECCMRALREMRDC